MAVNLGREIPAWELSRWNGAGLYFRPPDEEGFTLRGDTQRLVYKGRKKSHRFTILGRDRFEYDCVLNREPESNVVTLRVEGAERFDFFRQPDFVRDPFLKGSYAVYKKETLIGEGTGKLCHIHRPKIIDSQGRRVWGNLFIAGDCLSITIPEGWLSEATYPVIVDPVIGTSTVGSQTSDLYNPKREAELHYQYGVNRFLAAEKINGLCTSYIYVYDQATTYKSTRPVLFDDITGKPLTRRSCLEETIDLWLFDPKHINTVYPPCWKTGQFTIIDTIEQGDYFWYGGYGESYRPKFDYGMTFYKNYPGEILVKDEEEYYDEEEGEWLYTDPEYAELPDFAHDGNEQVYDFRFSWYFDYVSSSVNHKRTLTQGVTLGDSRKLIGTYKRNLAMNGRGTTALVHASSYYRKQTDTAFAKGVSLRHLIVFVRLLTTALVRDFIIRRFLRAQEELVLKSAVCREIVLESRIH
jgi:hypothetical protein